ncbi:MAG: toprim domain-containing protein, partial [Spirochaetia bacterium]|nr:toprim domain-containing protein [Spirochaetia bacterium]
MSGVAYQKQILEHMAANEVFPDGSINFIFDGKVHRFPTRDKPHHENGWYTVYPNAETGFPVAVYGDWALSDDWFTWMAKESAGQEFTSILQELPAQAVTEAKAEEEKRNKQAAAEAQRIWENAQENPKNHQYLQKKGIKPHIARVDDNGNLVIPVFDSEGNITSLRYISRDGSKKWFVPGGKVKGCYGILGNLNNPGTAYIAEGFATAASIFEATGTPTIITYGKSNMKNVSVALKATHPQLDQIIVADNDENEAGIKEARAVAEATGAKVILIPDPGMDANDYAQAGKDLKALLLAATSKIEKAVIKPENLEEAFKETLNLSW